MQLKIHDASIDVDGLTMSLSELASLRPGFEPPVDKVTVRYADGMNIQSDGMNQTAGPVPWTAADALIAEKTTLTAELDALRNPPISFEEARARKRLAVGALLDTRLSTPFPYAFPNSGAGSIDMRNQRDLINIQALVANAQVLAGQGIVDPVISFRDAEDQTHLMTPEQVIDLGIAVTQHRSIIYAASWVHKDAIAAAGDQAALSAIDITTGWPA